MEGVKFGLNDYEAHFDPQAYNKDYYSLTEGICGDITKEVFEAWWKVFEHGHENGGRFIDIGCGPVLFSSFLASRRYCSITLAEYTTRNRQELEKYICKNEDCYDWKSVLEFVAEKEGEGKTQEDIDRRFREAYEEILPCNVCNKNPLEPLCREPYDCISLSLVLDAACKDRQAYKEAVANVVGILKPGGLIIQEGVLGQNWYMVNGVKFYSLHIDLDFVRQCYKELSCEVVYEDVHGYKNDIGELSDSSGWFMVKAQKKIQ